MRVLVVVLILAAATLAACSRSPQQKDFASADEAMQALVSAARSDDTRALLEVLGNEAASVVDSGDPVQDRNLRQRFVAAYEARHALDDQAAGAATIEVGEDRWPFPIPLVQKDGRWRFDSGAGAEEIVNRRVGANELATIQSCLAFVDAEREYYARNPQQDPLLHFAQKFFSTEGQKDGLYWPTTGNETQSPLGEGFALARSEGYFNDVSARHEPYHGYLYRLLKAQGPNADGGAYDYIVRDKMLGGFALIAFPAEYGSSGVMSFIVNHDGVVFSKDLGPETTRVASSIEVFDPDQSWKREASIN
ncbi:DUF2950 domain-containing protein [Povalibacter sp.]|uniref:DUF2950 domain-containing protein n=1 Tax=Povalibacter sp. TaxID=1962978 RepID=UPI002F4019E3